MLLLLLLLGLLRVPTLEAQSCSPSNYTKVTNDAPMPADFCAFAYLPWRARLPENPQHTVASQTAELRDHYAPGSSVDNDGLQKLVTLGKKPTGSGDGNSYYPVYTASARDPLVSVRCDTGYGCSNGNQQQVSEVPSFRIPAWARVNQPFDAGDNLMEIIQPNGDTVGILGCVNLSRDFQTGDVLQDLCDRIGAIDYANIVTSPGVNTGNLNGGPDLSALVVHYTEVQQGQINHALLTVAGCFHGIQYPASNQALDCEAGGGIPSGAHFALSLTRAEIDALPTDVVPVHMRPFAYAAHEYGIYVFDSGNGQKWFSQPMLEQAHAYLNRPDAPAEGFWNEWFLQQGSGGVGGDKNIQLYGRGKVIDWSALAEHLVALDECYARGTCSDSVPEGQGGSTPPPPPGAPGAPRNLRVITRASPSSR